MGSLVLGVFRVYSVYRVYIGFTKLLVAFWVHRVFTWRFAVLSNPIKL